MRVSDCINRGCPYKCIVGHAYNVKLGNSMCKKLWIDIKDVKSCPIDGLDIIEVINEYRLKFNL